jgi:DNA-binding LacI/PurR family transcriptional regulator
VSAVGPPTLEQVAARAGVGRGTASRVINGSSQVSPRTREAVLQAVADLGYVPNQAARALVTRRTGMVALVIAESEERIFGEPFFAGVLRGISAELADASRQLVLSLVQSAEQAERLHAFLSPAHVDGVLALSIHDDGALPVDLSARGIPTVLGGRSERWPEASYVDVDNRSGARVAVEHLLRRGRRTVATITGPAGMTAGRDRRDGYADALRDAGHAVDPSLTAEGDFSEASGHAAMRALLERRPHLDAVFAASDLMALGAVRALREAGRSVPGDVGVVGFDGIPQGASHEPPLTTVVQPLDRLGREMARMVLRHVDGTPAGPEQLVLPVELTVGGTS